MSATFSPSQSISAGSSHCVASATTAEIDASCRVPVMVLLVSSVVWLLLSSVFAMIATLKFHAPNLLADCAWFTYGRVHAAHLNSLIYGFGMQAGLGVALWMIAHLGRVRLASGPLVVVGAILWNSALTLGTLGILYGESTGYEWLEMPRYASLLLFGGYILIAIGGMLTLHLRVERKLYLSQCFILVAFFWFPWIYTTANLLLTQHPLRGTLQAAVDFWYINNLRNIWFGFVGLAAIFYFVPKIVQGPLASGFLGSFVLWTLALFASLGGVPPGTPLPSWMSALSTAAAVVTVVPVIAAFLIVRNTVKGAGSKQHERTLKFFLFGIFAYLAAGISTALSSTIRISKFTSFTWYLPAQTQLMLYGFFAIAMFGAIYYIIPRLTNAGFPAPKMVCGQFLFAVIGILLYAVPLMIGGFKEGQALYDVQKTFPEIMLASMTYLRASTSGDLLMALGHLILALNVFGLLAGLGKTFGLKAWKENTRLEVAS